MAQPTQMLRAPKSLAYRLSALFIAMRALRDYSDSADEYCDLVNAVEADLVRHEEAFARAIGKASLQGGNQHG